MRTWGTMQIYDDEGNVLQVGKDIRRRMGARFGDGADDYEVNVRMPHDV